MSGGHDERELALPSVSAVSSEMEFWGVTRCYSWLGVGRQGLVRGGHREHDQEGHSLFPTTSLLSLFPGHHELSCFSSSIALGPALVVWVEEEIKERHLCFGFRNSIIRKTF